MKADKFSYKSSVCPSVLLLGTEVCSHFPSSVYFMVGCMLITVVVN